MSEPVEAHSSTTTGLVRPGTAGVSVGAFGQMFAAHAFQLFDYCRTLTGSEAAAGDATAAALACAQPQPATSHLLRASLFAQARREALASPHASTARPADGPVDGPRAPGRDVYAVLGRLSARHREVIALVYRYGIWPEQLPAVLGVSAWEAYERLAAAEHEFVVVAATGQPWGQELATSPALDDLAALPFAAVPGSVWRDAVAQFTAATSELPALPAAPPAVADPRPRARARLRVQLTAAAVLAVTATISWAIADSGGSARPVGNTGAAEPALAPARPVSWPTRATPDGEVSGPAKQATPPAPQPTAPTVPIVALLPSTPAGTVLPIATAVAPAAATEPTPAAATPASAAAPSAQPSPSPAAASPSDSPSASPSPSASSASPSPADSASAAPSPAADPSSAPVPAPTS